MLKAKHILNVCKVGAMIYIVLVCSVYNMQSQKVYDKMW